MRGKEHTPWSEIGRIAGEQWSQVRLEQLLRCGLSDDQVRHAVRGGRLYRSFTGVFSVGHPVANPSERAMAAVLAFHPEGLLAHAWALWNFGLVGLPSHPPDVLASPARHARPGITLHRTKHLGRPDHNHGIPTTTPNRAIIDAAPAMPAKRLRRLVNQAQILRLTTAESLRAETLGTRGVPTRRLLEHLPEDQQGATRSLLEDMLLDLHRVKGLPRPLVNVIVDGRERDFYYPALRLILEADGWESHGTRIAFEDDHETRLDLEANGRRVLAVTYRQVTVDHARTADRLERIIRASENASPR